MSGDNVREPGEARGNIMCHAKYIFRSCRAPNSQALRKTAPRVSVDTVLYNFFLRLALLRYMKAFLAASVRRGGSFNTADLRLSSARLPWRVDCRVCVYGAGRLGSARNCRVASV